MPTPIVQKFDELRRSLDVDKADQQKLRKFRVELNRTERNSDLYGKFFDEVIAAGGEDELRIAKSLGLM